MHPALPVERPLRISNREDPLVPDIWAGIETATAVTPQYNHPGRIKVVPRLGNGDLLLSLASLLIERT
ncbi:MAG: hypothetical protein CMK60_09845 [Proteobacteria bacterium]|nr:hypothetical protein [Pseudomonadota bacterium]MBP11422.1 hypothetical protein [Acidiferrobacteraceae bacterium]HCF73280.1 hypothetical protein [Gammaproteobacteria bacterium]